jgi:hypothetical protein
MILDAFQMFDLPSAPKDVGQGTGDYDSTNILDYGIVSGIPSSANGGGARDMGIGDKPSLKLLVQMQEALVSAGGGTLQVVLCGAVDDGSGAPASFSEWWASPIYTVAQCVAGARLLDIDFPRPPQGKAVPRFMKLIYRIATATTTAGTVIAGVVIDRDDQMYNSTDNSIQGGYRAGLNVAN